MASRHVAASRALSEQRLSEECLDELQEMELQPLAAASSSTFTGHQPPSSLHALRERLGERLGRGRDLLRAPTAAEEPFPTALAAVDPLLAGGLARGCLTELRGAPSSGRFGLVLALLAATTARGEAAALVDLGDQLDPQEAAACGVVLPRLLWARPTLLREALAAAEIVLGGDFPLVVLDLGVPPLPAGSRDEHAWLRLARVARLHRAALLVATPSRLTGSAAGEVLALSRRGGEWIGSGAAPRLLAGVRSRLLREKSRRPSAAAAQPGRYADLGLRAPSLLGPLPERKGRFDVDRLLAAAPPRRAMPAPSWPPLPKRPLRTPPLPLPLPASRGGADVAPLSTRL